MLTLHLGLGLQNGLFLKIPYQNAILHLLFVLYVSKSQLISPSMIYALA